MNYAFSPSDEVRALMRELGLPDETISFSFKFEVDEFVIVECCFAATPAQAEAVKKYALQFKAVELA